MGKDSPFWAANKMQGICIGLAACLLDGVSNAVLSHCWSPVVSFKQGLKLLGAIAVPWCLAFKHRFFKNCSTPYSF